MGGSRRQRDSLGLTRAHSRHHHKAIDDATCWGLANRRARGMAKEGLRGLAKWMGLVVKVTGLGKMDGPGKEVAGGSETRWG